MFKFISVVTLLFILCDLTHSRPSDGDTSVIGHSSPTTALEALSPLTALEALPAADFVKELILRHNEIADTIAPIMLRVLINPVPGLAETLKRSLALVGVTSYLVGPSFARSARNLGPVVEPIVGPTDSIIRRIDQVSELEPLFEQALNILGLNNDACREALTCQAGKEVASDYPLLATYLSQLTVTVRNIDDKFSKLLLEIMNSSDPKCTAKCRNLEIIERYWKESGEKDLVTVAQDAFSGTINNALSSLLPESSPSSSTSGIATRSAQCTKMTKC